MSDKKRCSKCGESKQRDAFSRDRNRRDGRSQWCKECVREYREANRERLRAQYRAYNRANAAAKHQYYLDNRDRLLARAAARYKDRREEKRTYGATKRYGITQEQRAEILALQRGACAICRVTPEKWETDHDHSCCPAKTKACGRCVRGLLCRVCNSLLGFAKDDINRLARAVDYLTDPPAARILT